VSGFRESKWTTVQKIKPGDYLLCYMIGISRSQPNSRGQIKCYFDHSNRLWSRRAQDYRGSAAIRIALILVAQSVPLVRFRSKVEQALRFPTLRDARIVCELKRTFNLRYFVP